MCHSVWEAPPRLSPPCTRIRRLPGKLTFWRRRAVAGLAAIGVGVGLWVALADGTTGEDGTAARTDAGELTTRRLAGQRLVAGFEGRHPPRASSG